MLCLQRSVLKLQLLEFLLDTVQLWLPVRSTLLVGTVTPVTLAHQKAHDAPRANVLFVARS